MIAWIASRTLQPRKVKAFRKVWQFKVRPQGLVRVYFLHGSETRDEMIGCSLWESRAALSRYRGTAAERERLAAMKPLVKRVNWAGIYKAEDVRLTRSPAARPLLRTHAT
jgi:heme-degrading monooxygenase HmoA